jgi:glutamine amidotransferase
MSKVVIIDYQLSNLFSVKQALANIGLDVSVSKDPADLKNADAVVLPGVGAFKDAMHNLHDQGMVPAIYDHINRGKPFMGVCLGLQLLFSESEEFGASAGLNLLPGTVRKFRNRDAENKVVRIPQIAWNEIYSDRNNWDGTPLQSIQQNEHMYFVHSFYVDPLEKNSALSWTNYHNQAYVSAVLKENIFACQFHPEKSAEKGLVIYRNWAAQNKLV